MGGEVSGAFNEIRWSQMVDKIADAYRLVSLMDIHASHKVGTNLGYHGHKNAPNGCERRILVGALSLEVPCIPHSYR